MATLGETLGERKRWADLEDSQEKESQSLEMPAPVLQTQDSYQESQASQGVLCELMQAATDLEERRPAAGISRRKHLEEISDDEEAPRGQKRTTAGAEATGSPATKRQRSFPMEGSPAPTVLDPSSPGQAAPEATAETGVEMTIEELEAEVAGAPVQPVEVGDGAPSPDGDDGDGDGNAQNAQGGLDARMQKRLNLIASHKTREDYLTFNRQFPRSQRMVGQPMTPDPYQYESKRQWESAAQKWREDLRQWYAGWGAEVV